jgi:hypothetical protein
MHAQRMLGVAVVALAGGLSTSASAGVTSYAGSNCKQEVTLSPNVAYQGGRVFAQSGSRSYFVCPAVQQAGRVMSAQVTGRNLNLAETVSCYASSHNEWDTSGVSTASVASTTHVNFTITLPSIASFFANGSKNVHCSMPPNTGMDGSSIGAYVVSEQ